MNSFWAGFGWIVGGAIAVVFIGIISLAVLFAVSKWIEDDRK
jgi:hypothetical protein